MPSDCFAKSNAGTHAMKTTRRNLIKSLMAAPLALLGIRLAKPKSPPDMYYAKTWDAYRTETMKLLCGEPHGPKPGQVVALSRPTPWALTWINEGGQVGWKYFASGTGSVVVPRGATHVTINT
jgi:hypothetical protein